MLGVSSAATIGLHFQDTYCGSASYSGFEVTMTAFGVAPSSWENLLPMDTGYNSCSGPLSYALSESISTTTSTNGLNPLPNGALTVNWSGPTANFSGFGGYAGNPPSYNYAGPYPNPSTTPTGEEEVYASFIRDGINFGPGESGGNNDQPGYLIDITGLESVFTNSSFVVELMASADSMQTLTNANIVDVTGNTTNTVSYPNTPPVSNVGDTPWVRGQGGGLSTFTGAIHTDHITIQSVQPAHSGGSPSYNHAGTISGLIITDKPVVSMSPQTVSSMAGDTVTLSAYAIGVPPLAYQWRHNGTPIAGATTLSYTVAGVNAANAGAYDLVVTNAYGSTVSQVAMVGNPLYFTTVSNVIYDSNPDNPQRDATNDGASWLASFSDGTTTRTGVMQFVSADTNGIDVLASSNFDSSTGTISTWMLSSGTDTSSGSIGAPLYSWPVGGSSGFANDFTILESDNGTIVVVGPAGSAIYFNSVGTVTDSKWHLITLTYSDLDNGVTSLYIDGSLDTSVTNTAAWSLPTTPLLEFGHSTDPAWENYNGLLDDIRIYNVELSAAQVQSVYTSGALVDPAALQMELNFSSPPGPGSEIRWLDAGGILQSSSQVNGPYEDVPDVSSPYLIVFPTSGQEFFRYRDPSPHTPQTVASNPYLM